MSKDVLTKITDWVAEEYATCSTALDMDRWPHHVVVIKDAHETHIELHVVDGVVHDAIDDEPLGRTFDEVKKTMLRLGYFDLIWDDDDEEEDDETKTNEQRIRDAIVKGPTSHVLDVMREVWGVDGAGDVANVRRILDDNKDEPIDVIWHYITEYFG